MLLVLRSQYLMTTVTVLMQHFDFSVKILTERRTPLKTNCTKSTEPFMPGVKPGQAKGLRT